MPAVRVALVTGFTVLAYAFSAFAFATQAAALAVRACEAALCASFLASCSACVLVAEHLWVVAVNEDDFKPEVLAVVADFVAVEHFAVWVLRYRAPFSDCLVVHVENLELTERLATASAADLWALTATAIDALAYNEKALLCFVAERACAVETRWAVDAQRCWLLAPLDGVFAVELLAVVLPQVADCLVKTHVFDASIVVASGAGPRLQGSSSPH